ncbi:4Fe-4S dicluster domain-containing protein [Xenophilus azovorans]|uniref:4Fe-4S dicluster domain-containing protein n=1 Tax=Xenophilus azovorans TaxID=151755 RepID=UPI0009FE916E|nr:4Fe-4S dicluster domain-containing protein [Xenophilus azovorans]
MSKWNLIIDVDLCCNCGNCSLAIKDEYVGNTFPGYAASQPLHGSEWFRVDRHVRGEGTHVDVTYIPKTCNHCDDAPCLKKGEGAVKKRDDGIVIIDEIAAKGRKDLVPVGNTVRLDQPELQVPPADHRSDQGAADPVHAGRDGGRRSALTCSRSSTPSARRAGRARFS